MRKPDDTPALVLVLLLLSGVAALGIAFVTVLRHLDCPPGVVGQRDRRTMLTKGVPWMSQHDHAGPVTVFKTNDPALLAFAQSLLDGANIDFVVAGAVVTGLTPGGVQGGYGVPEVQVRADDADEARELLKELA